MPEDFLYIPHSHRCSLLKCIVCINKIYRDFFDNVLSAKRFVMQLLFITCMHILRDGSARWVFLAYLLDSVGDLDPYVVEPSGSVCQRYGSGPDPSIISKNSKKNLDAYVL